MAFSAERKDFTIPITPTAAVAAVKDQWARQVLRGRKDLRERPVRETGRQVLPVPAVFRASPVHRARQARRESKANPVFRAPLARRESRANLVHKAQSVRRESRGNRAFKVPPAHRESKAKSGRKVPLAYNLLSGLGPA